MMIALGTSRIRIFSLIFLETLFLTLASSPVGLGISWIIISYYHKKGLDLSNMGKEMMSSFGFETTIYPEFPTEKLLGVLIIVSSTALLSAILPSVKALRLQPADALTK